MDARPNILLFTHDCLRRDAALTMRELQRRLRRPGWTEYARHYGVAHCSDPNYSAMLTGRHPDRTGIRTQIGMTRLSIWTLQLYLRKLGYHTWAQQPVKVPDFYRLGFDLCAWAKTGEVTPLNMPAARGFCRELGEPWYGFIRTMDLHYPRHGNAEVLPRSLQMSYVEAAGHLDSLSADFIDWVLGNYPNTVIILTADHGEMLGEHGEFDHCGSLWEELVHVPLWLYMPGSAGGRVEALTQHTDVGPTLMQFVGAELESQDGISIWPARQIPRRILHLCGDGVRKANEDDRQITRWRAVIDWPWKYISQWHPQEGLSEMLINLRDDPAERRNLAKKEKEKTQRYREMILEREPQWGIGRGYSSSEEAAVLERLRMLGYA